MIVLPNHGTDMMCQNTFGGKMIIFLRKITRLDNITMSAFIVEVL